MPSDADEVGSGCLLLNHLRCLDDMAQLMLDYSTIATPVYDDVVPSNTATPISVHLLKGAFAQSLHIVFITVNVVEVS